MDGKRYTNSPLRPMPFAMAACVALLAVALAASPVASLAAQSRPDAEVLPGGTWTVVDRSSAGALLAARPQRQRGTRIRGARVDAAASEMRYSRTLEYTEGASPKEGRARRSVHALPAPTAGSDSVRLRSATFSGRTVYFGVVGEGPQVRRSPSDGVSIFEHAGNAYRLGIDGTLSTLFADAVRGIDRASLRARAANIEAPNAEQGVLLWAVTLRWSADGRKVAFASNREAVVAGLSGQSIWVADAEGGGERPLLTFDAAESYSPVAWFGDEVLYTRRDQGIWAVNATSGQRRRVSEGAFLTADEHQPLLVVAMPSRASGAAVALLQNGVTTPVPKPPTRFSFEYFAALSPDATRLALVARSRSGEQRIAVYHMASRRLELIEVPGAATRAPFTDPPNWLTETRLLVNAISANTASEQTYVLRVQ